MSSEQQVLKTIEALEEETLLEQELKNTLEKQNDRIAKNHSKFAIMIWCLYGIYALFFGRFNGILPLVLYIFPGIFVASFTSMIPFYIEKAIVKAFAMLKPNQRVTVIFSYLILALSLFLIVVIARLYINLINNIF